MAAPIVARPHNALEVMSRPQIGIDRLPVKRGGAESKEAMNCKSCRKRKIKCTRSKPSCEACQVFNCACIYDAIPKKRGPKTDVLEALLKRVNGLEKRLEDEKKSDSQDELLNPEPIQSPQEKQQDLQSSTTHEKLLLKDNFRGPRQSAEVRELPMQYVNPPSYS